MCTFLRIASDSEDNGYDVFDFNIEPQSEVTTANLYEKF